MIQITRVVRTVFLFTLVSGTCITAAAEARTWHAKTGGFTVEAEFLEFKPGDIVRLKTRDGREIEVALGQLSDADQAYVRMKATSNIAAPPGKPSNQLTRTIRAADRCRLPGDAVVVFTVFHDDPQTSDSERAYAAARIAELNELAAKKLVRLNKKWVSEVEADAVRRQADELMRQGLELLKVDNETGFRQKFTAAAALEPEEIRADFLQAAVYTIGQAYEKALPLFQRCLARDPENVVVLNNIAILSVAKADWNTVSSYWRRALELQPDQRVIHNIGRFLGQAARVNTNIPKSTRDALSLPYAELVASGKFNGTDPDVGWLFLFIEASALDISLRDDDDEKRPPVVTPAVTEDGPVVGGGTGFIVHPGYVLTNAHVALDDATFEIQTSDGTLLKATRVAKGNGVDLALLKCEPLSAPPLTLSPAVVPRGTDVMLLGFPEMSTLGASLKATRGSISSLPDAKLNDRYLYDAVTNAGNSGGPVCDDKGNVIAVHYLGINTASRYGGGIPSTAALEFLRTAIPDYRPAEPNATKLDWPAVDAMASPSTVLIWIRKKNAVKAESSIGSDLTELSICLFCSGLGDLRCSAPGCMKGQVAQNGRSGRCLTCRGKGTVSCAACRGLGLDAQLASVRKLVARIAATGGRPTTTPAGANLIRPANGKPVELLPLIDLSRNIVNGAWYKDRENLVGGGVDASRVQIPFEPPAEYDVSVTVELLEGDGALTMGLVADNRQFFVAVRENGCGISCNGLIENRYEAQTVQLQLRRSTTITFSVRRDAVTVSHAGRELMKFDGNRTVLSIGASMKVPNPKQLFIGSNGLDVSWSISRITLVPAT